nr:immunoglobulin heavy chain junction region [Macaca mulatta]MOX91512.1 immunoglobulin heavy chain junction region [Macaca mulatta]MOX91799.1 immunoglobulin heavy chain junction region [Macaca mulatta]MOX91938.1 immunoglobulin heavy chain junction region [Macaca mulatta]MOX92001.1 immunoglobulin heavy chain junction region [Macaca mulatta]
CTRGSTVSATAAASIDTTVW